MVEPGDDIRGGARAALGQRRIPPLPAGSCQGPARVVVDGSVTADGATAGPHFHDARRRTLLGGVRNRSPAVADLNAKSLRRSSNAAFDRRQLLSRVLARVPLLVYVAPRR